MELYYAKIPSEADIEPLLSLLPPSRRARLKPFQTPTAHTVCAWALLAHGLKKDFGISPVPEIIFSPHGKPDFQRRDLHFSLSHTKTHALCAVSSQPVGADIEARRAINPALPLRVLSPGESGADFFDMWVLKESYIKLLGRKPAPFNKISFAASCNSAVLTAGGVFGEIFGEIPGHSAAVCTYNKLARPRIQHIRLEEI